MTAVPSSPEAARTEDGSQGVDVPEQRGSEPAEWAEQEIGVLDDGAIEIATSAEVAVIATADRYGERHVSVVADAERLPWVIGADRLAWPDESAQPQTAERANLAEVPEIALLLVQPGRGRDERRALHVNGTARVVPVDEMRAELPELPAQPLPGRHCDVWIVLEVGDAYTLEGDEAPAVLAAGAAPPAAANAAPPAAAASVPASRDDGDGESAPASTGGARPAPMPTRDRRSILLAALAIVLVVACVALALVLGRTPPSSTAAAPPPPPAPAGPTGPVTLYGRVLDVADPATIVVDVAGTPTRVGVVGLDAATVPACANPASLAFARRTLLNQTVTLVPDPTLPASPTPRAYVVLGTQLSYTDAAIRGGHAPAAGASQYRAVFDGEQREARSDGVGMWGPPCVP